MVGEEREMTIWKYQLRVATEQRIDMPVGAKILTVQLQGGEPHLWAMVNLAETKTESRLIAVFGTAHSISGWDAENYVGTFQLGEGMLVFHVFAE